MSGQRRYELTAADGTPAERIAKRSKLYAQPRVATIARASELLGIPEDELTAKVRKAQLPEWGMHASGRPVFKWPALRALVEQEQS